MAWGELARARAGKRVCAALVGTTVLLAAATAGPLLAQEAPTSSQPAQGVVSFSIPAGPLASALVAFSAASGINIVSPGVIPATAQTSGVTGSLTPRAALAKLIAGTGYTYRFTGATSVTIVGPNADNAGATVEGAIALDTIDVSGGGSAEQAAAEAPYQTPGSSAYISREQIQRIPPTSTGDIFKTTPGVLVTGNRNGVSMDVNFRGLQGMNRVNTMVDGAMQQTSQYRGYAGHDSRAFVDPEFIAGIDIEKGPGGSPGAMGGSVNMRTLNASDILEPGQKYGARVRGSIGNNTVDWDQTPNVSGNAYSRCCPRVSLPLVTGLTGGEGMLNSGNGLASVVAAASVDKFEVLAGYSHREAGNYFAGTHGEKLRPGLTNTIDRYSPYGFGEAVHNTSQDTTSAIAKLAFKPAEGHRFDFSAIRYESLYGEAYGDVLLFTGTTGTYGKAQRPLTTVTANTYTGRYSWTPADNPLIDFRANLWASEISDTYLVNSINDAFTWGGDASNTSRLKVPFGEVKLNYGAQYFIEDSASENASGVAAIGSASGERSMTSEYARAEYTVLETVRFDAGVRYDYYSVNDGGLNTGVPDKSDTRLNPNFGITLLPLDGVQIFAKYAEGWRPPSVRETFMVMSGYLTPNANLQPEESENWEYGVNVSRDGLLSEQDRLRLKVAYFDNDYINYIVRANPIISPRGFYNIPGVKMKGVEVSGSYDLRWAFTEFGINRYTAVQYCLSAGCAAETGGDDYGSYHIPPKYSGSVTLGARLFDEKLVLGGRATFAGERAVGRAGAGTIASDWAPYVVYDLFGSYEIDKQLKFDVSAENITDLYYLDALSNARLPSPGRTVRATVTKNF